MSTPSLDAEKWLLPTVRLYCRRTLQHWNPPRGNLILSPRMSHSTWIGLFLHCLVLFSALLFFSHQTEQPLMSALCYLFHHLSCHAPTRVYCSGVINSWLVHCDYRALWIYIFALLWWRVYLAPYVLLVDFPVFWLSAQRSVIVPQMSLSTVLVWLAT